jgi:hypothetical protein
VGEVLDLYQGIWRGRTLGADEYVICSDEKTSIQARDFPKQAADRPKSLCPARESRGLPPSNGSCRVMSREPYRSVRLVFWVVDNGSSYRGAPSTQRMNSGWPNTHPVYLPVHASWLNQMKIYFGIVQKNVLTPNDFVSLDGVAQRLKEFERPNESPGLSIGS